MLAPSPFRLGSLPSIQRQLTIETAQLTRMSISRKFWQQYLPRLKYHNPAIPMVVNRKEDVDGDATLSLYFRKAAGQQGDSTTPAAVHIQPSSSSHNASRAQPPATDEEVVRLDVKGKHQSEILALLVEQTKATTVQPTEDEAKEMEELAGLKATGEVTRQKKLAQLSEPIALTIQLIFRRR